MAWRTSWATGPSSKIGSLKNPRSSTMTCAPAAVSSRTAAMKSTLVGKPVRKSTLAPGLRRHGRVYHSVLRIAAQHTDTVLTQGIKHVRGQCRGIDIDFHGPWAVPTHAPSHLRTGCGHAALAHDLGSVAYGRGNPLLGV